MATNLLAGKFVGEGFENHNNVLQLLRKAQSVEKDVRDIVREVHDFLDQKDGQWEDLAKEKFKGRPRYTFDKCNDLVDDIAGAMEQNDFDIQILPAGGDATQDLAKTYDGLIRNIQNLSNANDIYEASARFMVRAGIDGWRVKQRWGDNNTFDQDLFIDPISDFVDSVWFDPSSVLATREDARYCFVLEPISKVEYKEKFPKGTGQSITTDQEIQRASDRKPEEIIIGELIYKQKAKRDIVEMGNGAVYIVDDKFQQVKDDLEKQGIVEVRRRTREVEEIKTRLFDGGDWLTTPQNTVFDMLPIVPIYANWSVRQSVPNYWGIVTKKLDAQRVLNYTESRKVEEGALAPLAKIVATREQVGGNESQWEKLNVSSDPFLPYVHKDGQPPPYKIGGAEINPGLEITSQAMLQNLQSTAGIDQLNTQSLGLLSGEAVKLRQERGDTRNFKYTTAKQRSICHTGKILMRAIPKVYDTKRQVRILNEDRSLDMVMLNDRVIDEQTGEEVEIIDLSKGTYDVTCNVSKGYKTRQGETVNAFVELAAIDPTVLEEGKDILLKSMNEPGMEALAERVRQRMVLGGQIPETQLSDEEKELIANQPPPEPDPVTVALQAEAEDRDDEIQLKGIALVNKEKELKAKIANDLRDDERASMKEAFEQIKVMGQALESQAKVLKTVAEAQGIEGVEILGINEILAAQKAVIRDTQQEQP